MNTNPGKLISILYRKSQIYFAEVLKEQDITTAEYPILLQLFHEEGLTQERISVQLDINKSAITRSLQSLLDKGFIERKRDEEDRRCNRIFLTAKGKATEEPIRRALEGWNGIMTKNIREEEMEQILLTLCKMVDNISDATVRQNKEEQDRKEPS